MLPAPSAPTRSHPLARRVLRISVKLSQQRSILSHRSPLTPTSTARQSCPDTPLICRETSLSWCMSKPPEARTQRRRTPHCLLCNASPKMPLTISCRAIFPHSTITTSTKRLSKAVSLSSLFCRRRFLDRSVSQPGSAPPRRPRMARLSAALGGLHRHHRSDLLGSAVLTPPAAPDASQTGRNPDRHAAGYTRSQCIASQSPYRWSCEP
jgi:hypothetical protein